MAETRIHDTGSWFADVLVKAFGQSLEAMTSEPADLSWEAVPADLSDLGGAQSWWWWEQPITAAKNTICWVGAPRQSWYATGKLALTAAGIDEASEEDYLGTWKEIVLQTVSAGAQAVGRRLRREVNCEGGKDIPAGPACSYCVAVKLIAGEHSYEVRFAWNEQLQSSLAPESDAAQPAKSRPESPAGPTAGTASPNRSPAVENSKTLGLLLEVELPISVSFGRAQLPLKDVLKLNSGSIVELNRSINEPVDLIVNNCVIARGEVVVVEGNYGVRIKQIISKEERLRTLY